MDFEWPNKQNLKRKHKLVGITLIAISFSCQQVYLLISLFCMMIFFYMLTCCSLSSKQANSHLLDHKKRYELMKLMSEWKSLNQNQNDSNNSGKFAMLTNFLYDQLMFISIRTCTWFF